MVPSRPRLPDEDAHLPRSVRREIERALGTGPKARDVALALSVGSDAIDTDRIDVAIQVLAWAKHEAPRIATIREAYGVACYLGADYATALTELQAYRRMTGRRDQNHLIADCLRGLGRDVARVAEPVEEMLADGDTPTDRQDEGVIIWAAALTDAGEVAAGRSVLARQLKDRVTSEADALQESGLRLLILAADLADRDDDQETARSYRSLIASVAPELSEEGDPDPDEQPER